MATNNFIEEGLTDDYDIYGSEGSPSPLPGSPTIDESGHLIIPPEGMEHYFPPSVTPQNASVFDPDPNNTGPTTDFWTAFPITIDVNGNLFYYGENTGINVRGPQGASNVRFENLTPEQLAQITGPAGQNGINGTNGSDGTDGKDGMSAYEVWLDENGWLDDPEDHPLSDFYQMLAGIEYTLVKEGTGTGSLIINDRGQYNIASGAASLATGRNTQATGSFSASLGFNTISSHSGQTSLGKYNENKTNSMFEVGIGVEGARRNGFEVDTLGNIKSYGEVIDGQNNTLSNKVDKDGNKVLSTNDFTNTYKDFIDNFTVDTVLIPASPNPISNAAVNTAINSILNLNGKSALEEITSDTDLIFGYITDTTATSLNTLYWNNTLTWNPVKNIFKNNNIDTSTFTNIFSFGTSGLEASANNQIILGQYNNPNPNNFLEIGWGASDDLKNILEVDKSGNLQVAGEITDGSGNTLSDKQDILSFDHTLVQGSDNLITSGDLYTTFNNIGINPTTGINIPELASLQAQITSLQARITTLEAAVAALGNPREIPDDTYPANVYTYGINDDQFYIQKIRPVDPEPEEEEEEENE